MHTPTRTAAGLGSGVWFGDPVTVSQTVSKETGGRIMSVPLRMGRVYAVMLAVLSALALLVWLLAVPLTR
jgi:hypothetical protein